MRRWGHVQLFSNNSLNVSKDGREVLPDQVIDDQAYLTGSQFLSEYLEPLAAFLQKSGKCEIHTGVEVLSVGKADVSKGKINSSNMLPLNNSQSEKFVMQVCSVLLAKRRRSEPNSP